MNRFFLIISLLCFHVFCVEAQFFPNYIAHGGGVAGHHTYTNSKEAILESIERGYTFIEVDIDTTSEGILVALHDWSHFHNITGHPEFGDSILPLTTFKAATIYEEYTPVTIDEVVEMLQEHPSINLVTDKTSNVDILNRSLASIKERVYVEAFSLKDFIALREAGYHPMYSHLVVGLASEIIENLLNGDTRIDFIVDHTNDNFKELERIRCLMPFNVAMFTSNSMPFIEEHLGKEIDLIYTDFFNPSTGKMEE